MSDTALTPSPEAVAALRGHPRFPAAMRRAATSAVDLYRGDRLLNAMMSDRARAIFTTSPSICTTADRDPATPA